MVASPLPPGSTIGILGGGQLGRMLALAAARLGLRCHVLCPDPTSPAFDVSAGHWCAPYDDAAALGAFANTVDVVTFEFENVPAKALDRLEGLRPLRPGRRSLATSQDRLTEKTFVEARGASVAPYRQIDRVSDLSDWDFASGRAVLKTRTLGYDGKGQATVSTHQEAAAAFATLGQVPCIIERHVGFRTEISAVTARTTDGTMASFEPGENRHGADHILSETIVPADVTPETVQRAMSIATDLATALDHVGVLAVEFFVVGSGADEQLLVNEIAPRVHNSGHWTEDGASVSQFEQHVRAVAGWPLASTDTLAPTRMHNLIGADVDDWAGFAAEPGARLHLYGKHEARPGRKMGHLNRIERPNPGDEPLR